MLVVERVAESVLLEIVWRKVGGQQQSHLQYEHKLPNSELCRTHSSTREIQQQIKRCNAPNDHIHVHRYVGDSYLWRLDELVEDADDEYAEAVDDELTGRNAVDVERLEVALQQPLGVLDIDVGARIVAT